MKKILIEVITVLILLALMVGFAQNLLKRKASDNEYRIFYECSKDIDVLFFGASVVHYSIYPMQLWNDYGITSYNMGNDSERLKMTYYDLLNSLDYANPKVVVVDLSALTWAGGSRDGTLKDHAFLDALPLSKNKINEVDTIFDKDERYEYLIPFTLYHSRWNELTKEDFLFNTRDIQYGASIHTGVMKTTHPSLVSIDESRDVNMDDESKTLSDMAKLCKDRGIKLVFIYLPYGHRGGDAKCREKCAQFVKSLDVDYCDLLYADFVDWDRDFIDGAHLNYYGGEKLTDYLGSMLSNDYNLKDHRADETISSCWSKDYNEYKAKVDEIVTDTLEEYEANN